MSFILGVKFQLSESLTETGHWFHWFQRQNHTQKVVVTWRWRQLCLGMKSFSPFFLQKQEKHTFTMRFLFEIYKGTHTTPVAFFSYFWSGRKVLMRPKKLNIWKLVNFEFVLLKQVLPATEAVSWRCMTLEPVPTFRCRQRPQKRTCNDRRQTTCKKMTFFKLLTKQNLCKGPCRREDQIELVQALVPILEPWNQMEHFKIRGAPFLGLLPTGSRPNGAWRYSKTW